MIQPAHMPFATWYQLFTDEKTANRKQGTLEKIANGWNSNSPNQTDYWHNSQNEILTLLFAEIWDLRWSHPTQALFSFEIYWAWHWMRKVRCEHWGQEIISSGIWYNPWRLYQQLIFYRKYIWSKRGPLLLVIGLFVYIPI